jgi:hypothetical protein
LHVHFLIWLNGCPANSTAVERILSSSKGPEFQQRVAAFAERIVTTNLPIGEDQIECSSCGAKFSALIGLPISAKTRKDPLAGIRSSHSRLTVSEPALIQCSICEAKFSSQHLLRSTLLKLRPNYWPPQERALTSAEIEEQATNEAICRDTKRQAMEIIIERETSYSSFSGTDIAMDRGAQEAGLLKQANSTQMAYCKMDQDPFRNDNLTRLFEVSPPSSFDARLSRTSVDYMVSTLAVQLNQHMWSHTSSCFKQSRATANDSYCRYRYPRERVEETSFDAAGIQLRRALCHEFMNGFNFELMVTFRCNHDIQVLLGGKDISDRIHYCCKYVTKQQKRLDSQVAVAVAAFKRRLDREILEACAKPVEAADCVKSSRKRVAAMVYNATNRQEVAGPLASLYLFRGSCCYSSAACVSLPIANVIRQLTSSDEYSCTLVTDDKNMESPSYRAVSQLDDNIFRPTSLQQVNLYEFTMWYFRKKWGSATTAKLSFQEEHPLHETHALGKRHEEVVPVIHGF